MCPASSIAATIVASTFSGSAMSGRILPRRLSLSRSLLRSGAHLQDCVNLGSSTYGLGKAGRVHAAVENVEAWRWQRCANAGDRAPAELGRGSWICGGNDPTG